MSEKIYGEILRKSGLGTIWVQQLQNHKNEHKNRIKMMRFWQGKQPKL